MKQKSAAVLNKSAQRIARRVVRATRISPQDTALGGGGERPGDGMQRSDDITVRRAAVPALTLLMAASQSGAGEMPIAQEIAQQTESAKVTIVVIAGVLVVFWRAALRALIAIVAIALMVLLDFGALVMLQGMHL